MGGESLKTFFFYFTLAAITSTLVNVYVNGFSAFSLKTVLSSVPAGNVTVCSVVRGKRALLQCVWSFPL